MILYRRSILLFYFCYVDSERMVLTIIVLTDRKTYTLKGLDSTDIDGVHTETSDKIKVSSKEEAQLKTAELIQPVQGGFKCSKCGHSTKTKSNLKLHIEIHFDGLQLPCRFCDKVFPSRANLSSHKSKCHRGL